MVRLVVCVGLVALVADFSVAADPGKKGPKKSPNIPAVHRDPPAVIPRATTDSIESTPSIVPESVDLKPVPLTGRKHWESILTQPASLDFDERESVTVKEIFDRLRERHRFSLRMDMPTFASLLMIETADESNSARFPTTLAIPPTAKLGTRIQVVSVKKAPPRKAAIKPEEDDDEKCESNEDSSESGEDTNKGDESSDDDEEHESISEKIDKLLSAEVPIRTVDLQHASVATVLRHTLDVLPIPTGAELLEMPFPMTVTDACLADYLVEDDGLLITTRMAALAHKEIRVYSIKQFKALNAEELSKVIRQSVRPWSWRSQINDFGDQLRGSIQVPAKTLKSMVQTGVQLAASEAGAIVSVSDEDEQPSLNEKSDAEEMSMACNAAVNGLVAFAHASLSGLQMFHYGEFPTATIETLPGKLIIRQSQAAHREIADLLKQLSEE